MKKEALGMLEKLTNLIYEQDFKQLKIDLDKTKIDIFKNNDSQHTLLHVAAKVENSKKIIQLLIQKGFNINILDNRGNTPLLDAVLYCCPKNLKLLIELGGDVELENSENCSPLLIACSNEESFECVKILLKNGALVNRLNEKSLTSKTPLNAAIYYAESIKLVKYLFKKGADVNIESPILSAISIENIEIIKYLIKMGAKINPTKNKNGKDVFDFAKRIGNKEIMLLIKDKKAKPPSK